MLLCITIWNVLAFADITINTYANSNVKTNKSRIRKGALIRPEQVAADPQPDDNNDDEPVRNGRRRTRESKLNQEVVDLNHVYSEYPMDFWWTLSEYIAPDDVGRFALICKATYAITGSVKFWKHLYKQYYRNDIRLPTRLQPDCMARPGGIRACVIRYLYYIYTPFLKQVLERPHRDFHKVTNLYVELFWFTRMATSKWLYFYKLKRKPMDGSLIAESEQLQRGKQKSLKSLRDVYMNSEEGCSLMIVIIFHFIVVMLDACFHQAHCCYSNIGNSNTLFVSSIFKEFSTI